MSEFFNEEGDTGKVDVKNLSKSEMEKVMKILQKFPKEDLSPEDTLPILNAARRTIIGSTVAGACAFFVTRNFKKIPGAAPPLAGFVTFFLASKIIGEAQRPLMWESIINGSSKRSVEIRKFLRGVEEVEVPQRPKIAFSSPIPGNFKTWDDIRREAEEKSSYFQVY